MASKTSFSDPQISLDYSYPYADQGELPVIDQFDALEAYRAYDDGALSEAPFALAAYVAHQQQFAL